jgi:hypothetical protein
MIIPPEIARNLRRNNTLGSILAWEPLGSGRLIKGLKFGWIGSRVQWFGNERVLFNSKETASPRQIASMSNELYSELD